MAGFKHKVDAHGHPEAPVGQQLLVSLGASVGTAKQTPGGAMVEAHGPKDSKHHPGGLPGHDDILTKVFFRGTVDEGTSSNDFSGFNLEIVAVHTPEPSSIGLAVGGILLFTFLRRTRFGH
jgi:hypothetical protein